MVANASAAAAPGDGVVPGTGSKIDGFAEKLTTLFPVWVSSHFGGINEPSLGANQATRSLLYLT